MVKQLTVLCGEAADGAVWLSSWRCCVVQQLVVLCGEAAVGTVW